jgi:transposase
VIFPTLTAKDGNMARHGLTDDEWNLIADVFPAPSKTGRPPKDRRLIVDGILWILRSGAPWRDLPKEFGPWETYFGCFDRWSSDGTFDDILHRLRSAHVDVGAIDQELWLIDGTIVRAHRCAGGGGKKVIQRNQPITL